MVPLSVCYVPANCGIALNNLLACMEEFPILLQPMQNSLSVSSVALKHHLSLEHTWQQLLSNTSWFIQHFNTNAQLTSNKLLGEKMSSLKLVSVVVPAHTARALHLHSDWVAKLPR